MIFRAPEPDVAIPETALTPFLMERALARRDKPAFIDGPTGRTITHRQWVDPHQESRGWPHQPRLRQRRRVCDFQPEPARILGCLPRRLARRRHQHHDQSDVYRRRARAAARDAGARYLVTVPPCAEKALEAARASDVKEVFVFGDAEGATPFSRAPVGRRRPARRDDRPAPRPRRASLLERNDRHPQRA